MAGITPFLWFDDTAEEAAGFYVTVFEGGEASGETRIVDVARYGAGAPRPAGTAMTVSFVLRGQEFTALNGGPEHKFSEATSFFVNCETQAEVDRLWAALTEGGEEGPCGWLKDRYGLSWQIVPTALPKLLSDPDPARAQRVLQAMLQMKKIDVAALERAHADA